MVLIVIKEQKHIWFLDQTTNALCPLVEALGRTLLITTLILKIVTILSVGPAAAEHMQGVHLGSLHGNGT